MRTFFIALGFTLLTILSFSQNTIRLGEVAKHVGDSVTVCGKIPGGIPEMNTDLLYTLLAAYVIACVVMFLIPEGLFPKGQMEDRIVTKKGFYRKMFLTTGAIAIVLVWLLDYFFI